MRSKKIQMVKKEFTYRGKTLEELKKLSINEFSAMLPARQRRSFLHGFTEQQKKLLERLRKKRNIETHIRDIVIIPEMVDKTLKLYNGQHFMQITILPEMLGHYLGEFVLTRKRVRHSAPGIGATKSSASLSVK